MLLNLPKSQYIYGRREYKSTSGNDGLNYEIATDWIAISLQSRGNGERNQEKNMRVYQHIKLISIRSFTRSYGTK